MYTQYGSGHVWMQINTMSLIIMKGYYIKLYIIILENIFELETDFFGTGDPSLPESYLLEFNGTAKTVPFLLAS